MSNRELTKLRVVPNKVASPHSVAIEIYRPFFLAGIITVLTAGCTLGAIALLGLSVRGSYITSTWTPYVLAHANSQLYGWVGFFIMGFALQTHPPRIDRQVIYRRLAVSSLALMALGIAIRFVADPLASAHQGGWTSLGIVSAILQTASVALFLINSSVTRRSTGEKLIWQTKFIFASLIWMAAVAVAEPIVFALSHQSGMASIQFVAEWFSPLREAQFLGFVANMIFGIALIKMNSCFGAKTPMRDVGNAAFIAWNVGIVLRMVGWVKYFQSGMASSDINLYTFSGAVLAGAAILFVIASRMFERTETQVASHKFIRTAFGWLLVSGALMMLEPLHLRLIEAPFSHAYIGGIRHALTVGFISQMIIGVSSHVISRMNSLPDSLQNRLVWTYWLINIGNAGRVILEIATDYTPRAFAPMGLTGFIELIGLAIWAFVMIKLMVVNRQPSRKPSFAQN